MIHRKFTINQLLEFNYKNSYILATVILLILTFTDILKVRRFKGLDVNLIENINSGVQITSSQFGVLILNILLYFSVIFIIRYFKRADKINEAYKKELLEKDKEYYEIEFAQEHIDNNNFITYLGREKSIILTFYCLFFMHIILAFMILDYLGVI